MSLSLTARQTRPDNTAQDKAFKDLIQNHLPLLRSILGKITHRLPSHIEVDDLYSVGLTGLVGAAKNCPAAKAISFRCYAATRIRGAILDELRRQDSLTRGDRAKAKRLGTAIAKLKQEAGGDPSQESICAEMDLTSIELTELMERVRPINLVSLDGIHEEDGTETSLHEIIADNAGTTGLDALDRKEVALLLAERMAQLPDIQKKVLAMSYYEDMKLSEIACSFGVTESRICQIRGAAISALKNYLTAMLA